MTTTRHLYQFLSATSAPCEVTSVPTGNKVVIGAKVDEGAKSWRVPVGFHYRRIDSMREKEERGRKPCAKRSPGLPEIEKRRKISKCWTTGLIAVRDGGVESSPRLMAFGKRLKLKKQLMKRKADLVQKARLQTMRSELEAMKMKPNETVCDFARKLSSIKAKFKSLGGTLKDKVLVRKLLNSVPKKFLPIVASIEQYQEIDKMSFEEAVGRITTFEERLKSQDEPEANYQSKLLMATVD
ncbi:hypothetical protein E3N88_43583 [Mikania micrantha]|uniref:Zinc finger, CCHC-type n=1 Tax=Mikania micrantha TaxID=192012 RepID=A0A5N6LEI0_9ASTR|nr:hypothetical protein E3N88_43583 [Mikania micrantha]